MQRNFTLIKRSIDDLIDAINGSHDQNSLKRDSSNLKWDSNDYADDARLTISQSAKEPTSEPWAEISDVIADPAFQLFLF